MKPKIKSVAEALLIIFAWMLAGCGNLMDDTNLTRVLLSLPASRAIGSTPVAVDSYHLVVRGTGMSPIALSISTPSIELDVPAGNQRTFTLDALDAGKRRIYQGTAVADLTRGQAVSISMSMAKQIPAAPSGFKASYQAGGAEFGVFKIEWTDNSDNEAEFELLCSDGTQNILVPGITANLSTFDWTKAVREKSWSFRLRASNAAGSSDYTEATAPIAVPLRYVFTFNSNGGSDIAPQGCEPGGTISKPRDPLLAGFRLLGWYTEPELVNLWDFGPVVTQSRTLYASWDASPQVLATINFGEAASISFDPSSFTDTITTDLKSMSISAPVGYSSYSWYLNGAPVGDGSAICSLQYQYMGAPRALGQSRAVSIDMQSAGVYTLTLLVSQGTTEASGSMKITLVN